MRNFVKGVVRFSVGCAVVGVAGVVVGGGATGCATGKGDTAALTPAIQWYDNDQLHAELTPTGTFLVQRQPVATMKGDTEVRTKDGRVVRLEADGYAFVDGKPAPFRFEADGSLYFIDADRYIQLTVDGRLIGADSNARIEGATTPAMRRLALLLYATTTGLDSPAVAARKSPR